LADGLVELKDRRTGDKREVPLVDVVELLRSLVLS
jgi:hypothetical protein